MASIIDRGMSALKNSEADYSLKIPLRTSIEGTWHKSSFSADIFTLMLIPHSRHIKFTINMSSQLGKNGHVSLLVLITKRMCGNFVGSDVSHLALQTAKSLSAGKHSNKPTDVSSPR